MGLSPDPFLGERVKRRGRAVFGSPYRPLRKMLDTLELLERELAFLRSILPELQVRAHLWTLALKCADRIGLIQERISVLKMNRGAK